MRDDRNVSLRTPVLFPHFPHVVARGGAPKFDPKSKFIDNEGMDQPVEPNEGFNCNECGVKIFHLRTFLKKKSNLQVINLINRSSVTNFLDIEFDVSEGETLHDARLHLAGSDI